MHPIIKKLYPSYRLWLRLKEDDIIGEGGVKLLKRIEKRGSITKASRELGYSYKYAWNKISEIEKKLEAPVVLTSRGGICHGGATLTELGKELIMQYEKVDERVGEVIGRQKKMEER